VGPGDRLWRLGGQRTWAPSARHHVACLACPSQPFSTLYGPQAGAPTRVRPGWGWRRRAKTVSARGCSFVLAAPHPQPVITPPGWTARSTWQPSYQPRRLLQPLSAQPGNQPAPRRLASRVGLAELSKASSGQCWTANNRTRCRKHAPSASECWRTWRLHGSRTGKAGGSLPSLRSAHGIDSKEFRVEILTHAGFLATLIGSRALSQLHSDSMGTCTGVRPSNSLAVHCLDHGRLLAVDDPLTSSYATNALLPMSESDNV
jgi:hypothetical protein